MQHEKERTPGCSEQEQQLLRAFQVMEQELVARGLKPKLMKLDNEASKLLKMYLHQQNITFQLVPPYSHRRNSAERAGNGKLRAATFDTSRVH
jgi:hypothetical protein